MNDALYEQLVTRKSRPMDLVIRILCIAALVVVLCGGMLLSVLWQFSLRFFSEF